MARIIKPREPESLPAGGWVGVDPGADGTVGYTWGVEAGQAEFWRFDQLTDQQVWDVFSALSEKAKAAALEKVAARPGAGVSGMFKFGVSAGKCQAWLIAARFRWDFVSPQKWQGDLKCRTGGDKKITQNAAQKLWPHLVFTKTNAEGLLIAEWCRTHSKWGQ